MLRDTFHRNVRARDQLELFLLSAVSSLLLVRFYLFLADYPQIAPGGLHIAHMLWGGALMLVALALLLSYLGARVQRIAAVVGGAGFGIFIDELGKFITADNDYFYQPTIGLIYAIFIILYLTFNFLSRERSHRSSRAYQLNALAQVEEAIIHDMDPTEKKRVRDLLSKADQNDPITKHLQNLLKSIRTVPPQQPHRIRRWVHWLDNKYKSFWSRRDSTLLVRGFFLLQIIVFAGAVLGTVYSNLDDVLELLRGDAPFALWLAAGQLVSVLIAGAFVVWGVLLLPQSHLRAYEQFRRATLVNIFLTQFFMFSRVEFAALPGFVFNLVLLGIITYAIRQEQRLAAKNTV